MPKCTDDSGSKEAPQSNSVQSLAAAEAAEACDTPLQSKMDPQRHWFMYLGRSGKLFLLND